MNVEGINIYAQLKEGFLSVSPIHLLNTKPNLSSHYCSSFFSLNLTAFLAVTYFLETIYSANAGRSNQNCSYASFEQRYILCIQNKTLFCGFFFFFTYIYF